MGYLSLEDIYPDDVHKYGHMRVGMTDLYVKDNHAVYGVVTRGEYLELTSRLLRDVAVQLIISARLAALPEDYDPWISRIADSTAIRPPTRQAATQDYSLPSTSFSKQRGRRGAFIHA